MQFVVHQDALAELTQFLLREHLLQLRLPHQHDLQQFLPVRFQVREQPDLLEHLEFSPMDESVQRSEHELKLHGLRRCKALGEKAYDQMYDAHSSSDASWLYSDAKEAFYDAIRLANELGLTEESAALEKRLQHIKAVFRSQFS